MIQVTIKPNQIINVLLISLSISPSIFLGAGNRNLLLISVICYGRMKVGNSIISSKNNCLEKDLSSDELKRASRINTSTVLFRNVLELPYEFVTAVYGDLFIWSMLGNHGKGKYLSDIKPSIYTVNPAGRNSGKGLQEWKEYSFFTNSALYAYYYRVENKELAYHFQERSLRAIISTFGLYLFIKIVFKRTISSLLRK